MKKNNTKVVAIILCAVVFVSALVIGGFFYKNKMPEIRYNKALDIITECESISDNKVAERKYKKALKKLMKTNGYKDSEEQVDFVKNKLDNCTLIKIRKEAQNNNNAAIIKYTEKLYDRKSAEKIKIYLNTKKYLKETLHKKVVDELINNLKNPYSFEEFGAKMEYRVHVSKDEEKCVFSNITYYIDYIASNSFGGRVRDEYVQTYFEWDDEAQLDINYEEIGLSPEEVAETLNTNDLTELIDKLI